MILQKGVHEYMDDWKKFSKTSLPKKEDFCSSLNMEDITDADYRHLKRVWKDFEIKKTLIYITIYLFEAMDCCQSMHLEIFEICSEICELDQGRFLTTPV